MKRNCNGCRALDQNNSGYYCSLGYKVEQVYFESIYSMGSKPLEECPKPKTYDKYLELKREVINEL